ncbi:MAG: hypothetical protein IKQ54_11810 [Oscillospiraceae bacterium]|nr:hypothetical protein [Oscillospiraceae bacterium]
MCFKRFLCGALLAALMMVSLCGCGGKTGGEPGTTGIQIDSAAHAERQSSDFPASETAEAPVGSAETVHHSR